MHRNKLAALVLTGAVALGPAAFAQQGGSQMQGMQGHNMGDMDMQSTMNQCAQMRQQMRPGAPMNAQMRTMMRQCDEMDRQMGSMGGGSSAPRTRTR